MIHGEGSGKSSGHGCVGDSVVIDRGADGSGRGDGRSSRCSSDLRTKGGDAGSWGRKACCEASTRIERPFLGQQRIGEEYDLLRLLLGQQRIGEQHDCYCATRVIVAARRGGHGGTGLVRAVGISSRAATTTTTTISGS